MKYQDYAPYMAGAATIAGLIGEVKKKQYMTKGVKTTFIPSGEGGRTYKDKYEFRSRKAYRKSRYDRVDCASGFISHKDFAPVSSNVAKAVIAQLGNKSDVNTLASLAGQMIPRRITSATITGAQKYSAEDLAPLMEVVWQKVEYVISNRNKHGCKLEIYDLLAKKDLVGDLTVTDSVLGASIYTTSPVGSLIETVNGSGFKSSNNIFSSALNSMSSATDLEMNVLNSRELREKWKICNRVVIDLSPGDEYTHVTFHRKNYVFDSNKLAAQGMFSGTVTAAERQSFIGGMSTNMLLRATGRVGHNAATSTFQGAFLDTVTKYTTYIREHKPYYETFMFDANANWDGEGAARTTVSIVEEDNPTDTAGI